MQAGPSLEYGVAVFAGSVFRIVLHTRYSCAISVMFQLFSSVGIPPSLELKPESQILPDTVCTFYESCIDIINFKTILDRCHLRCILSCFCRNFFLQFLYSWTDCTIKPLNVNMFFYNYLFLCVQPIQTALVYQIEPSKS